MEPSRCPPATAPSTSSMPSGSASAAWGDKAPLHGFFMDRIEAMLPEAHFIHMLRDGRDVCLSLRPMWFSPGWEVEIQARHWCDFVSAARDHGGRRVDVILRSDTRS